jgi:acyl-CoA synthetase (NDP forming)
MGSLDGIFGARSVAVVGASGSPDKTGHIILKNIVDGGYAGSIYPVNPKADTILGLKCYPSVSAIPGGLDLVVVVVPAKFVPGVIDEAGAKGAKGAVVISGGFGEIGNGELEDELKAAAARHGVRVIGPNCQGFNYTPNRLCASWPLVKSRGPIAVISQSGTVGAAMEMWAEQEEIGVSGFVALGNKSDVSELDLVEYFADDPNTRSIALYIEGIRDGRAFMALMRSVAGRKPVVVLKPGKTEKGKKAVASHTHSIAGSDEVFQGVCRQLKLTRASDVVELYDFSKALGYLKRPAGRTMLVVTSSGGCGILATDTAEQCGIDVAALNERTRAELKTVLPATCVIGNPLDLTGDANAERYGTAVRTAAATADADFFLLVFGDPIPGACEIVQELRSTISQEVVVCYIGGGDTEKTEVLKMHRSGIPVFPTPERAVRAVSALLASYTSERSEEWHSHRS